MKSVSKAALAAVIMIGMPATAGLAPAAAQNKNEKAPEVKLSAEFRNPAAEVQKSIEAKDWAGAKAKLDALDALAKTDDEKFYAANFRLQAAANTNDTAGTIAALDALLANPKTPRSELGRFNFFRGDFAIKAKKPAEALGFFTKARDLGYAPSGVNMNLLLAQTQFEAGQQDAGIANIDAAIKAEEAAGRKAPENWYKLVVSKLYRSGNKAAAADWLGRQIAAYPSPDAWRSSLLVFMEQSGAKGVALDADQRLDLLRLMRAAKAMGGETDYYEYADAAQRRGLPWEAKAVIEEGRANGKVPTASARMNQLYATAVQREKAEVSLAAEEKRAAAASKGDVAMQAGDAYLGSRNYAKAIQLYRLALQKGSVDANLVNTRLGIALALSGQKAEAKTAFGAVTGSPRADIAKFWTAWLDQTPA